MSYNSESVPTPIHICDKSCVRTSDATQTATTSSATTVEGRKLIAQHTLEHTKSNIEKYAIEGATEHSIFYPEQLPSIDPSETLTQERHPVLVVNNDSFTAARKVLEEHPGAKGKVAVLNMASDEQPGGGWLDSFTRTQEEALCYSSTLYTTLKPSYYPWPNLGPGSIAGVFSPGVVIFKDDLDHDCEVLPEDQRKVVSVITVAAPRRPKLLKDGKRFASERDLDDLRGKIRLVFRMAVHHGKKYFILGAFGCGVYGCPPEIVAEEMKTIFHDEFRNQFERVVFAVYDKGDTGKFGIFSAAFSSVRV